MTACKDLCSVVYSVSTEVIEERFYCGHLYTLCLDFNKLGGRVVRKKTQTQVKAKGQHTGEKTRGRSVQEKKEHSGFNGAVWHKGTLAGSSIIIYIILYIMLVISTHYFTDVF